MFGQTFGRKNSRHRRVAELREVLGQLLLVGAPREVRVGLAEPDLGQAVHHLRPGERLGQEERFRVGTLELAEGPFPERECLGVRVVDPEDLDAVADPELEDRAQLVPQALPVLGLEVERVDVLVFLRRVLGVLDRAVWALAEPGRVLADERVVGRDLECDVERNPDATGPGRFDQGVEVLDRPEVRMDGSVSAVRSADRPRDAGVVGTGARHVVRALAEGRPDRVDRRQVEDVEAEALHVREAVDDVVERAVAARLRRR